MSICPVATAHYFSRTCCRYALGHRVYAGAVYHTQIWDEGNCDEASMYEALNKVMQHFARKRRVGVHEAARPFGGARIVVTGSLFQTSAIVGNPDVVERNVGNLPLYKELLIDSESVMQFDR